MAELETITYEERNRVAYITLNRPQVHNSFNRQLCRELHTTWRMLRGNDDVRCIVITGAGDKAFCTGIDRNEFGGYTPEYNIGRTGATPYHFDDPGEYLGPKSSDMWKPVIAAVNGMACGGAFYILGEVEFIIAAEHATFFDPHTTYGMAAVFEPMFMLQRMPLGEIMRLSLLGAFERMSAKRACEIGLAQEVVPGAQLLEAATWAAEAIASQPTNAVQATVRAIWYAQEMNRRDALQVARTLINSGSRQEDLDEGQQFFMSGKRVEWKLR